LRGNDTLELYRVNDDADGRLEYITKYEMMSAKCTEIVKVKIGGEGAGAAREREAVVMLMPKDKVRAVIMMMMMIVDGARV